MSNPGAVQNGMSERLSFIKNGVNNLITCHESEFRQKQVSFVVKMISLAIPEYIIYAIYSHDEQKYFIQDRGKIFSKIQSAGHSRKHSEEVDMYSLFSIAVMKGDKSVANLFIDQDPSIVNKPYYKPCYDQKPIHLAIDEGNADMVRFLMKKGAVWTIQGDSVMSSLSSAIGHNHVEIAKILLELGEPVNSKDGNGYSYLHISVRQGRFDMIKLLLEKGAKVDDIDNFGNTALHFALSRSDFIVDKDLHIKIVRLLLKSGADIDAINRFGYTPLHYAVENNKAVIVKDLIFAGADLSLACKGFTSFEKDAKSYDDVALRLKHAHNADAIIRGEAKPYPDVNTLKTFVDRRREGLIRGNTLSVIRGKKAIFSLVGVDYGVLASEFQLSVAYVKELYKIAQDCCEHVTFSKLAVFTKEFLLHDAVKNCMKLKGVLDLEKSSARKRLTSTSSLFLPSEIRSIISGFFGSENSNSFDADLLKRINGLLNSFLSSGRVIMIMPSARVNAVGSVVEDRSSAAEAGVGVGAGAPIAGAGGAGSGSGSAARAIKSSESGGDQGSRQVQVAAGTAPGSSTRNDSNSTPMPGSDADKEVLLGKHVAIISEGVDRARSSPAR